MTGLIDRQGVIYDRGIDGKYRPRSGILGQQKDLTIWGSPNLQRDWLGNLSIKRDWLGNPVRSSAGSVLYYPSEGSSFTGSSGDVFTQLLLIALVAVFFLAVLLFTASISPILLGVYFSFRPQDRYSGLLWWLWIITCFLGGFAATITLAGIYPDSQLAYFPLLFYLPLGIFLLSITIDHQNNPSM